MILGASHVTLASLDIEADMAALQALGYAPRFSERLASSPHKRTFLGFAREDHALTLAAHERGLPIELVNYAAPLGGGVGVMTPVFAAPLPADAIPMPPPEGMAHAVRAALQDESAGFCRVPGLGQPAWFADDGAGPGGLRAVVIGARDLDLSRQLWTEGFGFVARSEGEGWLRLERKGPVAAWNLALIVCRDALAGGEAYLDSKGMSCLSMLSTNLAGDRLRILAACPFLVVSDQFRIAVNGREFCVEIYSTPENLYVELLQLAGSAGGSRGGRPAGPGTEQQ